MVNNKDIRTSDLMHLLLLWTFSPIFNFEQAFADWVVCRHQPSLCLPVSNQLWTIFTSCFSIFTTNFEQGNTGSYFHTSIHRRSQQNMLQLNVNRKNTAGFFQTNLQHCIPLWYPHNFSHDSPLHSSHAIIHFKLCCRHDHEFLRHTSFEMIYICSKYISFLILEPVSCQFWLILTHYVQKLILIIFQVWNSVD